MKVLIADDCEISRELLAVAFEGLARVKCADDGERAVQFFTEALNQEDPFNLVCLDITMPRLSGHEVLRTIRTLEAEAGGRKTIVFMITASSSPDDMLEGLLGSCDDYLTKPVVQHALRALLSKHGLLP
ncbi:response regulator [Geobacter argillaceus]|uniref:Two-component system chemotaxis response regulator CheY n=1 Tax=Geobacter argillaceus TaxID=345631 RepID=A0A562VIF9_9BACT|nr:response regulator [Geobacter argillaceus]TWJ17733.1 two-component system chemotaxis response regulator CheY [Geobacter argillaceus]